MQYDVLGAGYAAFRGMISVCDGTEAKANYWTGWDPFYPNGSSTSVSTRQKSHKSATRFGYAGMPSTVGAVLCAPEAGA